MPNAWTPTLNDTTRCLCPERPIGAWITARSFPIVIKKRNEPQWIGTSPYHEGKVNNNQVNKKWLKSDVTIIVSLVSYSIVDNH